MTTYTPTQKDSFKYGDNQSVHGSYAGYLAKDYVIRFENARIESSEQDAVEFKAFITAFKDLFKPEWNEETVYGRTEPIGIYKGVSRRLSFGFDAPADSVIEGKDNLSKTEDLVKLLYPTYHTPSENNPNYKILSQSPLVRVSFVNIIKGKEEGKGLLGYITSFDYDLNFGKDIGVFDGEERFITPRLISFNIDFTVLHEIDLGYDEKGMFRTEKGWLYGVEPGKIDSLGNKARLEAAKKKEEARLEAAATATTTAASGEPAAPEPVLATSATFGNVPYDTKSTTLSAGSTTVPLNIELESFGDSKDDRYQAGAGITPKGDGDIGLGTDDARSRSK
jgi:hypothetical protein